MDTKLTINIDQAIIKNAQNYAKINKKSVSKLVEDYLSAIYNNAKNPNQSLSPITKEIAGIIKIDKNFNYDEVLTQSLMEKYL
ncbi:MAG: DUF6364 family protein [Elusimicrobiota bacterium]|jgi:hypothetical protein|nr:DUF6364 family protein [Elusimicrobiota bacterium]